MSKKKDSKPIKADELAAEEARETEAAEAAERTEPEAAEEAAPEAPEAEKGFRSARAARKEAELKKELETLKADSEKTLAAEKERYLRLAAEFDNFRRRSQKEREAVYADATADTVLKLLPVYDNLARALKAECADAAFYKGVEMTMGQLMEIFQNLGVAPIEAVGLPFDPAAHNAVLHVEDEALGENTVAEEFQTGFTLHGKVIRFAMVKVAN